jgi:hypothetical protein
LPCRLVNSSVYTMYEIVVNLHMHTLYSDGFYSHTQIAQAALQAGLDAVIVTDHNVLVKGPEGYRQHGDRKILIMIGEEIHDQTANPQKNHLLALGVDKELAPLAVSKQNLLDTIRKSGGLAFLAHIVDLAAPAVGEKDISWEDWQVQGFTGIELWNGFSEFKSRLKSKAHALFYAFNPHRIARGPDKEALRKWDELLNNRPPIVAIGGSDAHALPARLGPIKRTLFPYVFHFRCINNHILISESLLGDEQNDKKVILEAIRRGCIFIGYDLPASTKGFRFTAHGEQGVCEMGSSMLIRKGVTLQIHLPKAAECRLIKDGKLEKKWNNQTILSYTTTNPGIYRVEAYLPYLGRRRGWIFSNPIYLKGNG